MAVNPPSLQILRIDWEGMMDDVIISICDIWSDWFISDQSHYCLYYSGNACKNNSLLEFTMKRFNFVIHSKINCQTTQNI